MTAGPVLRRARLGIARLFGFGVGIGVLAAVSLAAIPVMVAADGAAAWGAVALGQAIGAIGAVLVNYGWGLSGPAAISLGNATVRRRIYADSVRVRLVLFLPVALATAFIAGAVASNNPFFAVAGSVQVTATGLTGGWYFIGVARPYAYLILETLPRAGGTVLGIVMMKTGFNAIVGLACTTGATFLALMIVSFWVYCSTNRSGARHTPTRPLGELIRSQRSGLLSTTIVTLYTSAPLVIFSVLEPSTQPNFALANKIQLQLFMGLSPFIDLMQSWVPKGIGNGRFRRADASLVIVFLFACASASILTFTFIGKEFFRWLGGGEISFTDAIVGLVAILVVANLVDATFRRAVLPSFGKLDIVTWASVVGAVIGLPLVALGVLFAGVVGALTGVIAGVSLRIIVEAVGYLRLRGSVSDG